MRKLLIGTAVLATLAAGAFPASGQVSTPVAPSENVEYESGDNTSTGGHSVVEGNRLYVGAYGLGFRIFDISTPEDPQLIGGYTPGARADAVPDAAMYGDRHFAVLNGTRRAQTRTTPVGEVRGTDISEFLDVTNPAAPRLLHVFAGQEHGEAHNGDIVDARRLWLPSGGAGPDGVWGLRIYSIARMTKTPAEQCRPGVPTNPCAPVRLFNGNPVELWRNSPYRRGRPIGRPFTHTHDIEAYLKYPVHQPDGSFAARDIILLAEGGNYADDSGDTGSAFVIDITDPRNPVVLLRWLHERGPGHHPIRYHHEAQFIDGETRVMLVTDEDLHNGCGNAGGAVAVQLSADLTRAKELSEWFIPFGTPAPVCSVHVFSSNDSIVYFGSYNAGLQIVDFSNPRAPRRV
ncbi:MAG TPA: hypothetical protein VG709_07070, partial [Actinomycetota bacterium]|nr:hypothetical protein [Actinomycetota bacterium]